MNAHIYGNDPDPASFKESDGSSISMQYSGIRGSVTNGEVDLSQGNLNPNDYSNNIDVDAAGSYAYFLDKRGIDNSENGNRYQKLAGIDAKDGLVLFNLEAINSN